MAIDTKGVLGLCLNLIVRLVTAIVNEAGFRAQVGIDLGEVLLLSIAIHHVLCLV